jgi:glycosyltransferase involved in cell wall biosynthesis
LLSGRRLDPERFETLLVHGLVAAGEESMADVAAREGARTIELSSLVQPVRPSSDARALASLVRITRQFEPDIVHTHTAKAGFVGRQAALLASTGRGRRRPVIVHTFHGHVLEGYFGPLRTAVYRGLERSLGRRSDRLIGVSQATVNDLVRLGVADRDRFMVVPLGLDLEGFVDPQEGAREQVRAQLGVGDQDVLVFYVGRVVPIKRLDVLLRAVAVARSAGSDRGVPVHLALAGDGEIRGELEELARSLGIGGAVSFLGYRRDLPELAAAADIAAISSDNEGTPVSLIEAGAASLPAVATDVGGVSEVVLEGETGLLSPAGDHDALGASVVRLAADAELRGRMGTRAREHVLQRYSIDRLLADIDALYEELLTRRGN